MRDAHVKRRNNLFASLYIHVKGFLYYKVIPMEVLYIRSRFRGIWDTSNMGWRDFKMIFVGQNFSYSKDLFYILKRVMLFVLFNYHILNNYYTYNNNKYVTKKISNHFRVHKREGKFVSSFLYCVSNCS